MVPFTPRRIVAGVAPDDVSDDAVHAGARLARAFAADLELVHAVQVPPVLWPGVDREQLTRMHEGAVTPARSHVRDRLFELERRYGLAEGELTGHLECLAGDPDRVLVERARAGADLVVVGPHRHRGVLDFGRTVRGLLPRLECALWVQHGPWREVERVLVPVDFSEHSLAGLQAAADVAGKLRANVHVVHVLEPHLLAYPEDVAREIGWPAHSDEELRRGARSALQELAEQVEWGGVEHEVELVDGVTAADEIVEHSPQYQLVVMGTRGHTLPLLGRDTYAVLRRAECPVLALRAERPVG